MADDEVNEVNDEVDEALAARLVPRGFPATKAGVKAFQRAVGVKQTGKLDAETSRRLAAVPSYPGDPSADTPNSVRAWQDASDSGADGVYDADALRETVGEDPSPAAWAKIWSQS